MNLKDTYNRIAEDWAKDHYGDNWWVEKVDKFLSLLPEKPKILDVGCGAGIKSQYLIGKVSEVFGIDFSEKMIEVARANAPKARLEVKDIKERLNLEQIFDGVFAQAVLLHIPKSEILKVLKNILDPLKMGGYLYLAFKEKKPNGPEEETVKENDYGYDYERFFSYYTSEEMDEYLRLCNLIIVDKKISLSHAGTAWVQIIAKK